MSARGGGSYYWHQKRKGLESGVYIYDMCLLRSYLTLSSTSMLEIPESIACRRRVTVMTGIAALLIIAFASL